MAKKFTLHLDALIVLIVVFLMAIAAIVYQRSQYLALFDEHVQLQWKAQDLEVNVGYLQGMSAQYLAKLEEIDLKDDRSLACSEHP